MYFLDQNVHNSVLELIVFAKEFFGEFDHAFDGGLEATIFEYVVILSLFEEDLEQGKELGHDPDVDLAADFSTGSE